jgi:hypothetical protein
MNENKEYHPCGKEKGFCPSLDMRVKHPNLGGYGFVALITMNLLEKKPFENLKGVMYKTECKDKGLMLSYCPFCGAKIDWWREKEDDKSSC